MSKVRTGDVLACEVCGLTVIIDEECGCAAAEIICCDETMVNKGPAAPKKKISAPKKKSIARKIKAITKKKAAKKKSVKKSVAKKKPIKKKAKKK